LPAIYRAAVAKSGDSAVPDTPHASDLLPVPGRSRARALLRLRQNQKQSSKLLLPLLSLLIFIPRTSRHHKTRLGCRPNAGDAQWSERHGCRESAARTWMSVRRGPTERRRSAGTRRSRAKPGARHLVTWCLFK
jgi:hypothetical protein